MASLNKKQSDSFTVRIGSNTEIKAQMKKSDQWFQKKLVEETDKNLLTAKPRPGRMYQFVYSAKTADVLPYWDKNPLIIMLERAPGGFMGLNLHYLPPKVRLVLLEKLHDFATNKKQNENTRFRMTWDLLKNARRYREVRPTLKRYLYSHVRTKFAMIPADEWEKAVFLPTARFVGKSQQTVWADSKDIYLGK